MRNNNMTEKVPLFSQKPWAVADLVLSRRSFSAKGDEVGRMPSDVRPSPSPYVKTTARQAGLGYSKRLAQGAKALIKS